MATPLTQRWFARLFAAIGSAIVAVPAALAHCPICTAATGAAVGIARFYGVDDAIMGVLIGGFAISTGLWANNALLKRKHHLFPGQGIALVALSLIFTVIGLKAGKLLTGALLWGMPRLLSGMVVGSIASVGGHFIHTGLRSVNSDKNYVALQGMNIMLATLVIASLLFVGGML